MKLLPIALILLCIYGCISKEKRLNTLQDFKVKYKNLTFSDLAKHDIGVLPQKHHTITLKQRDFKKEHRLEYIDSIILIPLETKEECLIGEVKKILYYNHDFYVFDKKHSNLFVFNESGEYKYKIGEWGRAPEEYLNISDFCISGAGQICLLDDEQKKILIYHPDGKFIESYPLENYYTSITSDKNYIYLSLFNWDKDTKNQKYKVTRLNTIDKTTKGLLPLNPIEENSFWRMNNLGTQGIKDSCFIYFPYFGNQVYFLNSCGRLKGNYRYIIEDYTPPPYLSLAARNDSSSSKAYNEFRNTPYCWINNVINMEDYLFTEIIVRPFFIRTIYNKITGKAIKCVNVYTNTDEIQDFIGDRVSYAGVMPDNTLIGSLIIAQLTTYLPLCVKNIPPTYKKFIDQLNEDDNPVLALIKIKTD